MPRLGRQRAMILLFPLFLLWTGLAAAQETATGQPTPGSFEQTLANLPVEALHQIQREDNLHLIAGYYYGDARQWPKVYAANRNLIGANPSVIHKGQILKILLPAGWAPLEPYDRFVARVRATGIPGMTAPAEAGGGKAGASAPTAAPAAAAPAPPAQPAPTAPAPPEPAPETAPKSY